MHWIMVDFRNVMRADIVINLI